MAMVILTTIQKLFRYCTRRPPTLRRTNMKMFTYPPVSNAVTIAAAVFFMLVSRVHFTTGFQHRTVAQAIRQRNPYQRQQHSLLPTEQAGTTCVARSLLSVCMKTGGSGQESSSTESSKTINFPLIFQNLANQAVIGCTIWTGGAGYKVLTEQAQFGPGAILLGTAGVIPLIALSRVIETSESPYVSGLNLSTNMAVLRLFGPTPQPVAALFLSLFVASCTGIVEETTFRGQCKYICRELEVHKVCNFISKSNITEQFHIDLPHPESSPRVCERVR